MNSDGNNIRHLIRKLRYVLKISRSIFGECPCCGYESCFDAVGDPPRYGAFCPSCGSYERHCLLAL